MGYLIVWACITAYGIYYAINPMRSLKRKFYMEDEVPETAIKTARIVGGLIAIFGGAAFVISLVRLLA